MPMKFGPVTFDTLATVKLKGLQARFMITCLLLDSDALERLQTRHAAGEISALDFARAWLVGWPEGEVQDERGNPVPFSDQALESLLKRPGVPVAVLRAFYAGYDEATEGNSAPLPAGS